MPIARPARQPVLREEQPRPAQPAQPKKQPPQEESHEFIDRVEHHSGVHDPALEKESTIPAEPEEVQGAEQTAAPIDRQPREVQPTRQPEPNQPIEQNEQPMVTPIESLAAQTPSLRAALPEHKKVPHQRTNAVDIQALRRAINESLKKQAEQPEQTEAK